MKALRNSLIGIYGKMHGEINVKCISRNTLKKKNSQCILYFNEIFHSVSSPLGWNFWKMIKKETWKIAKCFSEP